MKFEMDSERLDAIVKDLREVAKKHEASMMEMAHAVVGMVAHQYYRDHCFGGSD